MKYNNKFDRDMHRGDWVFTAGPWFIGFVFLVFVAYWSFLVYTGIKVVHSLKDCTPAVEVNKDANDNTQYTVGCKK